MGKLDRDANRLLRRPRKKVRRGKRDPREIPPPAVIRLEKQFIHGQVVTVKVLAPQPARGAYPGDMTSPWRRHNLARASTTTSSRGERRRAEARNLDLQEGVRAASEPSRVARPLTTLRRRRAFTPT